MSVSKNDELMIYRGRDYIVNDNIVIHQCSLDEIERYGEDDYWNLIYSLTATPQTFKGQLWKMGVDYTTITPYELYYKMIVKLFSVDKTSIIFGDLDFQKFSVFKQENDEIVLYQEYIDGNGIKHEIMINETIYEKMVDYLRLSHKIKKDEKIPGNESTKMILIDDAIDEMEMAKNKEKHSYLKNLISTMLGMEGFNYTHFNVWDLKISAFMDYVNKIPKIKMVDVLLQSGHSGFGVDLKSIDTNQINYFAES